MRVIETRLPGCDAEHYTLRASPAKWPSRSSTSLVWADYTVTRAEWLLSTPEASSHQLCARLPSATSHYGSYKVDNTAATASGRSFLPHSVTSMGSRIAATLIVLAAVAALLWVALGGNATDSATESVTAAAPTSAPAAASRTPQTSTDDTSAASDREEPENVSTNDGSDSDTTVQKAESDPTAVPEPAANAPENFGPRMDLVDLDGWLNTDATSIDDFNGKVLLVEMWTFGCSNCKARIPYNQGYYEKFGDQNFEIIGVHAPEFSYEADVANIENALVDLGVTWPVALDTDKLNFRAWQPGSRSFWPRSYVIDQNGDIRYDHIGEGKYEELRDTIRYLVENPPPATSS